MDYWEETAETFKKVFDDIISWVGFVVKIYETFPEEFKKFYPEMYKEITEAKEKCLKGEDA